MMRTMKMEALGTVAVVLLGTGLGIALFAFLPSPSPGAESVTATPWVSAYPTARPAPTPGAIGSTGHLPSGVDSILWVDELGLRAWNRTFENRDDKGMTDVMHVFTTLRLNPNTAVMVTNRSGDAIQVEVISGYAAGRRGWMKASYLQP